MLTRLLFVVVAAAIITGGPRLAYAGPKDTLNVNVKMYGAKGDGATDDTGAIQAAIDSLQQRGGGTLTIPAGTYLLNSYKPSPHPWFFYNLRAGSNIRIAGEHGAKLLQGPSGRAKMSAIPGASAVATSVLVFGSPNYVINTFQDAKYNGGFCYLHASMANDRSITLANPSEITRFKQGDYVAIYAADPAKKDVTASESSQIVSVITTGIITLAHPLARAFDAPRIANVNNLATLNVGVANLIVQGTVPLNVNEVFGFTATGNSFISDTSVREGNEHGPMMNDIRGMSFVHNTVTSTGPNYASLELPQRNSQDVVINSNTIEASAVGFGEYGAHYTITNNRISVHPDQLRSGAALFFGGYDVTFSGNHINGVTSTVPLVADWVGMDDYCPYVGRIRITNNTFECKVDKTNCLSIAGRDTEVTGNEFVVTGNSGEAILVEGPMTQAIHIRLNRISVQSGIGIVLNSPGPDQCVVSNNTLRCTGSASAGIYAVSQTSPNPGEHVISHNKISGFRTPISIDISKHPKAVVSG